MTMNKVKMVFRIIAFFILMNGNSIYAKELTYKCKNGNVLYFEVIGKSACKLKGNSKYANYKKVSIPDVVVNRSTAYSVVSIAEDAFIGCSSLVEIEIPYSVRTIEGYAFAGCKSLKRITLPTSVTQIKQGAFQDCSSLESVDGLYPHINVHRSAFDRCMYSYDEYKKYSNLLNDAPNREISQVGTTIQTNKITNSNNTTTPINKQQTVKQNSYNANKTSAVDINIPTTKQIDRNTFAVIIGNENYKNVSDVQFAANDARIFGYYVEKTLGVPREQIKLIENATFNDIRLAIKWLSQAMNVCEGKGKAILYYAGHGIPNESNNSSYLLPVDGIGNDPASAYSLSELYDKLSKMQAQSITVFLDACFSGNNRGNGMLVAARGVAIKAKQSVPKGNMVVFSAAQGDETAYPYQDMQHGLFTYFLLKKLQETEGNVTFGELGDYLKSEVKRQSFLKNNKVQTPVISVALPLQNRWKNIKMK